MFPAPIYLADESHNFNIIPGLNSIPHAGNHFVRAIVLEDSPCSVAKVERGRKACLVCDRFAGWREGSMC
jgi:hypothetical protein